MDQQAMSELRGQLVVATRRGFDLCRQSKPGETIYAYALVMASVVEAIQPWCHSEETNARQEAKRPSKTPAEAGFRRYNPDEWWATAPGPIPWDRGTDWWHDLGLVLNHAQAEYGRQKPDLVLDLCCEALRVLDEEGYFGTGAARAAVTLMVYVSDSGDRWWKESVRRLNPPEVAARFRTAIA